jgi:O-phosphoseryl-tRNA(Cys) synthetase
MKYAYIDNDTFVFHTHEPSYDEVDDKIKELKQKGWTKIEYEKGYKHVGSSPFDTDYIYKARIYGRHKATKADMIKEENGILQAIKETSDYLKELRAEQREIEKKIKNEQKDLEKYAAELSDIRKIKEKLTD